ncbi:MAG: SUMF1/EgtB/PvdO family nonheme iron enzyme [Phycisphaerales bacterium]|nr:SUMF1/EgtB/PvdO family nonheme iron enzyme [Phycisphaerales bacterium]
MMHRRGTTACAALVALTAASVLSATPAHADLGDQLAKLLPSEGASGDHFGRSVAISGATAIVGAYWDDDNGEDSGSAYLFDTTTGQQIAKLLASDGAAWDNFGGSVAISGTTAIVGAWGDDDNGSKSGSAYLFDTTTGQQIAKLLASDGAASDKFGVSVAICGTTAIVGAWGDSDNGVESGSAYLFDTITGQQFAKLLPSDGAWGDAFGLSVAISGTTAIVGAVFDDDNGDHSGSAYLFDATTGQQLFKLLPSDGAEEDWFGLSVAISGAIAIVGALFDDDNGEDSGSAYLFDATTGQQLFKLLPSDGAEEDWFGDSVAIGATTAIVGARWDSDNGDDSGSAYLFDTTTGQQIAKVLASDGAAWDEFGDSVAISGATAIVGAYRDDDNGFDSGSAYLFDTATGQQIAKLLPTDGAASDGAEEDFFGHSVAISGATAIVGAHGDDDNGSKSGSAYLFDATTGQQTAKLLPSDGAVDDQFGRSVAISGTTAIVGAFCDDDNGASSGSAYLFDTTTGQQVAKLLASDGAAYDCFGYSVAISGTTAIVGAYMDDNGGNSGSAYLFDTTTGQQFAKLLPSDGAAYDWFGHSVAISGTAAIVGACEDDDNGDYSGSAYLFDTTTGLQIAKLLANDGAEGDYFGHSVAINGTTAIVGAPLDGDNGFNSGSAYLFDTDIPTPCPGDLDGDNDVDQNDLGILLACYTINDGGDCDGDGDTDQNDLGILLAYYGTDCDAELDDMSLIPSGEFEMGDHYAVGDPDELPVHDVYIDSFYMDVYETTNQRYCAYLNSAYAQGLIEVGGGVVYKAGDSEPYCDTTSSNSYSRIHFDGNIFWVTPGKEDHPMVEVSWYGAAAFANRRSTEEGRQPSYDLDTWECNFSANGYRLPTEAEWEYAARGGEHAPYYKYPWGDTIDGSKANYGGSGDPYESESSQTTPVGYYDGTQTPPGTDMANGYGLYDMAGNVWEWCNDWSGWNYYDSSPYDNPRGPTSGTWRVLRSGSWINNESELRCADRNSDGPGQRRRDYGIRLVLD